MKCGNFHEAKQEINHLLSKVTTQNRENTVAQLYRDKCYCNIQLKQYQYTNYDYMQYIHYYSRERKQCDMMTHKTNSKSNASDGHLLSAHNDYIIHYEMAHIYLKQFKNAIRAAQAWLHFKSVLKHRMTVNDNTRHRMTSQLRYEIENDPCATEAKDTLLYFPIIATSSIDNNQLCLDLLFHEQQHSPDSVPNIQLRSSLMNHRPYRSIYSKKFIASGTIFYREKPFLHLSLKENVCFLCNRRIDKSSVRKLCANSHNKFCGKTLHKMKKRVMNSKSSDMALYHVFLIAKLAILANERKGNLFDLYPFLNLLEPSSIYQNGSELEDMVVIENLYRLMSEGLSWTIEDCAFNDLETFEKLYLTLVNYSFGDSRSHQYFVAYLISFVNHRYVLVSLLFF
jgi:hypothetical protein